MTTSNNLSGSECKSLKEHSTEGLAYVIQIVAKQLNDLGVLRPKVLKVETLVQLRFSRTGRTSLWHS